MIAYFTCNLSLGHLQFTEKKTKAYQIKYIFQVYILLWFTSIIIPQSLMCLEDDLTMQIVYPSVISLHNEFSSQICCQKMDLVGGRSLRHDLKRCILVLFFFLSASWLQWNEPLSTAVPFYHAISSLELNNRGLKL